MTDEDALIEPSQLEAGAVVPQCLDNMYLSDATFAAATAQRTNLLSPAILAMKEKETRTEYLRSLVYASQVIVNRAYFINNPVVNSALRKSPENADERRAFLHLLRSKVIVPYLWKERSFAELPDFDLTEEGRRSIQDLLQELGAVPALRLSRDDAQNALLTSNMGKRFGEYFLGLRSLDDLQVNVIASELFNAVPGHEEALPPDEFERFREKLYEVAEFAFAQSRGRPVTREALYKQFVCEADTKITDGWFRQPRPGDFVVELKKLCDLRYNTNLPDFLGRFTFAPVGLPGRSALCDETMAQAGREPLALDALLDNVRRLFVERAQKAMTLPLLGALTLSDVCDIRNFPTWTAFTKAQEAILSDPTRLLELLPRFGEAFEAFQTELSSWYYVKHRKDARVARYATVVSIAVSIGGKVLSAKYGGAGQGWIQKAVIGSIGDLIPKQAKGAVAKLLVAIYDADRNRLDRERSYSVDIWKSQAELTREQVEALTAQFGPVLGGGGMANSSAGVVK